MKYLLILTFMNLNDGVHDVSRFEYDNISACTDAGYEQAAFWLAHIPDIDRVAWQCVEKEY